MISAARGNPIRIVGSPSGCQQWRDGTESLAGRRVCLGGGAVTGGCAKGRELTRVVGGGSVGLWCLRRREFRSSGGTRHASSVLPSGFRDETKRSNHSRGGAARAVGLHWSVGSTASTNGRDLGRPSRGLSIERRWGRINDRICSGRASPGQRPRRLGPAGSATPRR